MRVSAMLQAKAAPEAPAPIISTSTLSSAICRSIAAETPMLREAAIRGYMSEIRNVMRPIKRQPRPKCYHAQTI